MLLYLQDRKKYKPAATNSSKGCQCVVTSGRENWYSGGEGAERVFFVGL